MCLNSSHCNFYFHFICELLCNPYEREINLKSIVYLLEWMYTTPNKNKPCLMIIFHILKIIFACLMIFCWACIYFCSFLFENPLNTIRYGDSIGGFAKNKFELIAITFFSYERSFIGKNCKSMSFPNRIFFHEWRMCKKVLMLSYLSNALTLKKYMEFY